MQNPQMSDLTRLTLLAAAAVGQAIHERATMVP